MSPARVRVRGADITDDAFIRCRSYNHSWDEFFPIDLEEPWYGWRLSLRCIRCSTERHDTIDFKGQVMSRRYIYPEGYQQKGEDKMDRTVFREELFSRLRGQLEKAHGIGGEVPKVTPIGNSKKVAKKVSA
jgi:hypothetical protein